MTAPADLPLRDLLLAYLADARGHPVTIGRLAQWAGASRRDTEEALEAIATDGLHGLVADGRGVRLASDPDEIRAYVESLRRRTVSMYRRIRSQRAVERRLRGIAQMEMFG